MTETYTLVGTDSSWVVAAMPLPAILLSGFMRKRMGQKPAFGWKPWVFVVYAFLAAVGGLPQEWIFAGACWMGGLGILLFPTPTIPPIMRYGFFLCFGLLGIPFLLMSRIRNDQLTLNDDSATYRWLGRTNTVPRSGLRISVILNDQKFMIRRWGSWTSRLGKDSVLGPSIVGFDYYWGPHGLIRGDDLAANFARWAGVVPTIQTEKDGKAVFTPMAGYSNISNASPLLR